MRAAKRAVSSSKLSSSAASRRAPPAPCAGRPMGNGQSVAESCHESCELLLQFSLVTRVGRRLIEAPDRHNDTQPFVGTVVIALAAHLLHHIARFHCSLLTIELDEEMSEALDVEVGDWHVW